MQAITLVLCALFFCVQFSKGQLLGIGVAEQITDFSCFPSQGYVLAFIRAYQNSGKVDNHAKANILAAAHAGMYINIYINPCPKCNITPELQVDQVIKELKDTTYVTAIVMIKRRDNWGIDKVSNCQFLKAMLTEIKKNGITPAIGSDIDPWSTIMGSDCIVNTYASDLLWEKPDKKMNFDNFKSFGGYTKPNAKEYDSGVSLCNQTVDLIYIQ